MKLSAILVVRAGFAGILALLMAGCGQAGPGEDDVIEPDPGSVVLTGAGTPGAAVSDEGRVAVFSDIADKLVEVRELDDEAKNQALGEYLSSLEAFEEAGYGPEGAWGRFTDGRLLYLDNEDTSGNHQTEPPADAIEPEEDAVDARESPLAVTSVEAPSAGLGSAESAASARNRKGLPWSTNMCLYDAVGDAVWLDMLKLYLEKTEPDGSSSYAYTTNYARNNATVEALMNIPADCAVIGLASHGGTGASDLDGNRVYAVYTATKIGLGSEIAYKDMLSRGELAYYHALKSEQPDAVAIDILEYFHYAFTAKFAERYWAKNGGAGGPRFYKQPFVYFNTCRAYHPVSMPMVNQILAAGASVYAGWTLRSFGEDGNKTASYVFDRLLGAGAYDMPASMPQRPFGWDMLKEEMAKLRLGWSIDDKYEPFYSELKFVPAKTGNFALLAPSITYLMVDDMKDELYVYGDFDGQTSEVHVDGNPCPITLSIPGEIHCTLPRFGTGSSGDVVMHVRGNASNHVKLTSWKGKATYRISGAGGALTHEWTFDLHMRGDIHDFRVKAGRDPVHREKFVTLMLDSSGSAEFGGTYQDGDYKVTWDGSLMSAPFDPKQESDKGFAALLYVPPTQPAKALWLLYAFGGSENHETEWEMEDGQWQQISDMQRVTNMPMGPELVGGVNGEGVPFMLGFTYNKAISVDATNGVIRSLDIGPKDITGFGNFISTSWDYQQTISLPAMTPEQGTAPDPMDAR